MIRGVVQAANDLLARRERTCEVDGEITGGPAAREEEPPRVGHAKVPEPPSCTVAHVLRESAPRIFGVDTEFREPREGVAERPSPDAVAFSFSPRRLHQLDGGMYLGRCFLTTDQAVGEVWAEYKSHPALFCTVQDDDFVDRFRELSYAYDDLWLDDETRSPGVVSSAPPRAPRPMQRPPNP